MTGVVMVTQGYHLPRAVATCRALGIRAEGVGDVSVRRFGGAWLQGALRDQVACVKTVLDLATRRQPVLGPPRSDVHEALTVIYATGSAYRKLGIADETRLSGYGVSWCATCDGFFFRQKTVAVVGGGDSAMEEATFLTKFADKVYVIHRSDKLRASKIMQDKAHANPKIRFAWNSVVEEIADVQQGEVTGITLRSLTTGERTELPVHGLFVAIGHTPNTAPAGSSAMHIRPAPGTSIGSASSVPPFAVIDLAVPSTSSLARYVVHTDG